MEIEKIKQGDELLQILYEHEEDLATLYKMNTGTNSGEIEITFKQGAGTTGVEENLVLQRSPELTNFIIKMIGDVDKKIANIKQLIKDL